MIRLALLSLLVGFSGAVVPGPLFAVTLQQALVVGWMAGVWLITGHLLAELTLLCLIRIGLGGVLQRPAVTRAIGLVGGLVMLYFAWGMLELALHGHLAGGPHQHIPAMSTGKLIGQGVLLSVLNPYWVLWWATIGVGMIGTQVKNLGARAWLAFFLGHELADYLWYVGISVLVGLGGAFISVPLHRGIIFVCGLGITLLGALFIFRPVREWLGRGEKV